MSLVKCLIFGAIFLSVISPSLCQDRDWYLDVEGLWQRYGYEYEDYHITTEDGYIIFLERIRGRLGDDNSNREPFYANIPLGTGEGMLFLQGTEDSPGFRIVDAGYDLWFINPRGTTNSRAHISLSPSQQEFWDFDLVDICQDHIAAVTFILSQTGYPQVHGHGYSSGATSLGHAIALYPEFFNPRIRSTHYVAGTMSFAHVQLFTFQLMASFPNLMATLEAMGVYSLTNENIPQQFIGGLIWGTFPQICLLLQEVTAGQVDVKMDDPVGYTNFIFRGFSGFSNHLLAHTIQSYRTGEVTYFDYGEEGNLEEYGTETPPRIPYENHEMPVALYYSPNDLTADQEDAEWFADLLGETVVSFNLYPRYSHFTFDIGKDMYYIDDLIEIAREYPIEMPSE